MQTDEDRAKKSAALKSWCADNPDKVRERAKKISGANNYQWKGGSSRLNTSIRRMTEHRQWANAVVRRDGMCLICGKDTDLEAHHVKPLAEIVREAGITNKEQARQCVNLWDISNGTTLCEQCHYKHHGRNYASLGNGRRKKPRKGRPSMAGDANPNYRGGKVSLTCPQCSAAFQVKQAEVVKRKYCSRKCHNESQRKNV